MAALFASGRIVDFALLLLAGEAVALVWLRRSGRAPRLGPVAPNLVSGGCLLLALRAALRGAWWGWVALWLAGGLVAHLADLRARGRRPG